MYTFRTVLGICIVAWNKMSATILELLCSMMQQYVTYNTFLSFVLLIFFCPNVLFSPHVRVVSKEFISWMVL